MRFLAAILIAIAINLLLFWGMQQLISNDITKLQASKAQIIDYVKVNPTNTNLTPPPQKLQTNPQETRIKPLPPIQPVDISTPDKIPEPVQPQLVKPNLNITPPKLKLAKPYLGRVEKIQIKKSQKKIEKKVAKKKLAKPKPVDSPKVPALAKSMKEVQSTSITNKNLMVAANQSNLSPLPSQPQAAQFQSSQPQWVLEKDLISLVRNKPRYPRRLKKRRIQGHVIVEFTIDTSGRVTEPKIVESQPSGAFDKAVLKSIKRWKFQPKHSNGLAIAVRTRQRIEFKLKR